MDKKHCSGCSDNFYNGNNPLGVKECWLLKKAKIVNRIMIRHWEEPPYKDKKVIKKPNCYHGSGNQRTHYVAPERIGADGYWR